MKRVRSSIEFTEEDKKKHLKERLGPSEYNDCLDKVKVVQKELLLFAQKEIITVTNETMDMKEKEQNKAGLCATIFKYLMSGMMLLSIG